MAFNVNGVSENYTDGPAETASLISRSRVLRKHTITLLDFAQIHLSLIEVYLSVGVFLNVATDKRCARLENISLRRSTFPPHNFFSRKLSS